MSSHFSRILYSYFFLLLFCNAISFAENSSSLPIQTLQHPPIIQVSKGEQTVDEIWTMLLQSRISELQAIDQEVMGLFQQLPTLSQQLSKNIQAIERNYQQYSAMAKVSRGLPIELSLVEEQLKTLDNQLTIIMSPLVTTLSILKTRLKEVSLLENDEAMKTEAAQSSKALRVFVQNVREVNKKLDRLEQKVNDILKPADILKRSIQSIQKQLATILPNLWKNYYLVPSGKLYEPVGWVTIPENLTDLRETFFLRANAELPIGSKDWGTVGLRFLILFVPLMLLIVGSNRYTRFWSDDLKNMWNRISKYSLILLALGFSSHFAAWIPTGVNYYILSMAGTMFMSSGQVGLAWSLYTLDKADKPIFSPFWRLLIPLFGGIVLLLFNFSGVLLSLFWLIVVITAIYSSKKRSKIESSYALVNNLLQLHVIILWVALIMTVFGWARLSVLVCMGYTALAICIQQGLGFIRLTNYISQHIPQEGFRGLFSGMLLALALPATLILATFITGLWILAYPGGAYLITHMTNLDFSIGKVSFSLAQVLLLVSAFYVTRSFVSVGRMFIANLPTHNINMEKSLVGPIQTGFTYTLWAIFIFFTLYLLGVSLTSLAVVAGGLSVGIGFGLQNITNNFISGLLMIFGQTLREGDIIEVGNNLTGVVKKINIRSTLVETFDNATIFVPNSEFLSARLTNWTRNGRTVRKDITVGVAYDSDIGLVMSLLKDIADNHPQVLRYPEAMVLFNDFAASSLNFILRFWVGDISQALDIITDLRVIIAKRFSEKNIDIAFPQLDIHIRNDSMLHLSPLTENSDEEHLPITSDKNTITTS